jgi:hypothetical protein
MRANQPIRIRLGGYGPPSTGFSLALKAADSHAGRYAGVTIRVRPSKVQIRTFELLGAEPKFVDLSELIEGVKTGAVDAQENPFANTVTYGVHKFHRFHTATNHFYLFRPIFLHRPSFDSWPQRLQEMKMRWSPFATQGESCSSGGWFSGPITAQCNWDGTHPKNQTGLNALLGIRNDAIRRVGEAPPPLFKVAYPEK